MLDARAGLTPADSMIAKHLRVQGKKTFLVANKIDGQNPDVVLAPFYELGLGELFATTVTHGKGVKQMMEAVLSSVPDHESGENQGAATGIKIAIIGRPNVGKSTLVNRMLGEDRVVAFDQPGTTTDSIYINIRLLSCPSLSISNDYVTSII